MVGLEDFLALFCSMLFVLRFSSTVCSVHVHSLGNAAHVAVDPQC